MKPRILWLLLVTCLGAIFIATKGNLELLSFSLVFYTCLGLLLSAGGANAVNMWFDADIDSIMERTKTRPVPSGKVSAKQALWFGIFLGIFAHLLLWWQVNFLTACMASAGYLFYVFIYTMYLKRRTVQNIVIGGAAGSFPPLVGWAAVQNEVVSWLPWAMFLIIFLWTPPHFWALALKKRLEYEKANIPMLPVVKGAAETKAQIVYYLLILLPVTFSIGALHGFGFLYFTAAVVLGGVWLYKAVKLMYDKNEKRALDVFFFSLIYLSGLFAAMVLDTFI